MCRGPFATVAGIPEHGGARPLRPLDARLAETTKNARTLAAVVLAAGKGKRLKSSTPKVLHPICGRPALWHVLQGVLAARPTKIVVVVGHGADDVRAAVTSWGLKPAPVFVEQTEQLGTGHAVLAAEQAVGRAHDVIVVGGDFDPVTGDDLKRLIAAHRRTKGAAAIFVTELDEPGGYARVVHERGSLVAIVEGTDAPAALRPSKLVSPLIMVFRRVDLFRALPAVGRDNRKGEYYLNEVLPILMDKGERVSVVPVDTGGTFGVNSRDGLAAVERVVRRRINATHLDNGVTIVDPNATYIDVDVHIGRDSVIRPMTFLEGETRIGSRTSIGPSTRIVDSTVGDRSEVTFAVVLGSTIGRDVRVGPFVRMRPGTVLEDGSKAGAFVDLKNATVGKGSKVPHLSYVGDADLGEDVNVGAGTVTVNFDGYEKHRTVIHDGASIGSDTMLIAPVTIGKDANTGAGSVITKDVPAGALAVERSEQRNVEGYRERKDAEHRRKGES
jgi:bifunctional UDP-N-acetylglucosamine pyrophosphorylase / glucosamine-1-phosphate N-acetyltransferase